jgi:FAD synthase
LRAALRREAAQLSGEQFVALLAERFAASAVVVGQDFRFGRGGAGSVGLLQARPMPDGLRSNWCRRCAWTASG